MAKHKVYVRLAVFRKCGAGRAAKRGRPGEVSGPPHNGSRLIASKGWIEKEVQIWGSKKVAYTLCPPKIKV